MILRCSLDGLLLPAELVEAPIPIIAYDGEESFALEAVEAVYYEVVVATQCELIKLEQAGYRLLRKAEDFEMEERSASPQYCCSG